MTILEDRLPVVLGWHLESGGHSGPDDGACIMEAVAYLAGEEWSDRPNCASPILAAFMRRWNDDLDDVGRQELRPYIARLVGTRGTQEQEDARGWMAADWLVHKWVPLWLRAAGLDDQARTVEQLLVVNDPKSWAHIRNVMATARDAAYARRNEKIARFKVLFVEELKKSVPAEAAGAAWAAWAAEASERWLRLRNAVYDALKPKFKAAIREKFGPEIESAKASAIDLLERMLAVTETAAS